MKYNIQDVKAGAAGRWPETLAVLGIELPRKGSNAPCPGCGGVDRFRWTLKGGEEAWFCSQGTGEVIGGDIFKLVEHVKQCEFGTALRELADVLQIAPERPQETRNEEGNSQARGDEAHGPEGSGGGYSALFDRMAEYEADEPKKSPGRPESKNKKSNFIKALEEIRASSWVKLLRHNTLTRMTEKRDSHPVLGFFEGPWTDEDDTRIRAWLHYRGIAAGKEVVRDIVDWVAKDNSYDPLEEHLMQLQEWDGYARIDTWLIDYLGVEDNAYTRAVGRKFLIQMVARAMSPGCKADCMLILEGGQGTRKSTALEVLASKPFFSDNLPSMMNKDASEHATSNWLIEVSDLEAMKRSEIEVVKAFISRKEERYRPPYAARMVIEPRRCVFAGTTNEDTYLIDSTGNRRFWPVRCGHIDIEGLQDVRGQLLREAFIAYRNGEPWHLDQEQDRRAEETRSERRVVDPWEEELMDELRGKTEITNKEIYKLLDVPSERKNPHVGRRIHKVMKSIGWAPCKFDAYTRGFALLTVKHDSASGSGSPNTMNANTIYTKDSIDTIYNNKEYKEREDRGSVEPEPESGNNNREGIGSVDLNVSSVSSGIDEENQEDTGGARKKSNVSDEDFSVADAYDDRIKCQDCRHYFQSQGRCYKYFRSVVPDLPRRCDGYERKK